MTNEAKLESAISALCVSCGLCCDGTLFKQANLKDKKDSALADSLGLKVIEKQGKEAFLQPCHHFKSCCTIYQQPRPKVYGNYYCQPLTELKKGVLTLEDASALIERAVRLKQQFTQACQSFPEFANQSISQIRPQLQSSSLTDAQQRGHRERYGVLLIIGLKLFPLLDEIKQKKKAIDNPWAPFTRSTPNNYHSVLI